VLVVSPSLYGENLLPLRITLSSPCPLLFPQSGEQREEGGVWAGGEAARPHPHSLVSLSPRRRVAWGEARKQGYFLRDSEYYAVLQSGYFIRVNYTPLNKNRQNNHQHRTASLG